MEYLVSHENIFSYSIPDCQTIHDITMEDFSITLGGNMNHSRLHLSRMAILTIALFAGMLEAFGGSVTQNGVTYTTYSNYAVVSGTAGGNYSQLIIPAKINGLDVTEVTKDAFDDDIIVGELVLPDTVKTLRKQAFNGCTIYKLTLGNGLKTIEEKALEIYGLTSLTIPDSVTSIGRKAFVYFDALETLSLPSKCTFESYDIFDYFDDYEPPLRSIYVRGGKPNYELNSADFINHQPAITIYLDVPGYSTLWGCPVTYTKELTQISVSGAAAAIAYGADATYTCTATFWDGPTAVATPSWSLSNTSIASVSTAGKVTNKNTSHAAQSVTLNASYTKDGITKTDSFVISLDGKPNQLQELEIAGKTTVTAGVDATYIAQATYADGGGKTVIPQWTIVSGGDYASISADGVLSIASFPAEELLVTIKAEYSEGGVTRDCTLTIHATPMVYADSIFEYTYVFNPGWQFVSIVLNLDETSRAKLLALKPFAYQGGCLRQADDLSPGLSCWIFVSEKTTVKVTGTPCGVLKSVGQ